MNYSLYQLFLRKWKTNSSLFISYHKVTFHLVTMNIIRYNQSATKYKFSSFAFVFSLLMMHHVRSVLVELQHLFRTFHQRIIWLSRLGLSCGTRNASLLLRQRLWLYGFDRSKSKMKTLFLNWLVHSAAIPVVCYRQNERQVRRRTLEWDQVRWGALCGWCDTQRVGCEAEDAEGKLTSKLWSTATCLWRLIDPEAYRQRKPVVSKLCKAHWNMDTLNRLTWTIRDTPKTCLK